jgi:hypothetical protein
LEYGAFAFFVNKSIFFRMMLRSLLVVFVFVASAFATHVAVLETGADESAKDKVSLSDRQYLTNVLHEQC